MPDQSPNRVTQLIESIGADHPEAEGKLAELVYDEMRQVAAGLMRNERPGHTLQPTALVNEAFIRLRPRLSHVQNRRHFFAAVKIAMRRVLVDHARKKGAKKRDPGDVPPDQFPSQEDFNPWGPDLVAALEELEQLDPRQREIVEYRYFLGLTVKETAEQLGVSVSLVEKDWRSARAWLYGRMTRGDEI